jgi:glycogen debranching enzyme
VFHADGRMAEPPIALCEVQGYVYAAKCAGARIARALKEADYAQRLEAEAAALQENFERAFWCEEIGSYALALDGNKKQCCVRASNAGHALLCKIASQEHAERVAASLMSEHLFSGWGIRTIDAREVRYNPMSYHNGSVWPHDNALVGLGFCHYGLRLQTCELLRGMHAASRYVELHRLPELFCGFHRRADASGPTLYPVACAPQAWAAGSVYMLLQACLGLKASADDRRVQFVNPSLPTNLTEVRIENLQLVDAAVDLRVRRDGLVVSVEVLQKAGKVEILESV